MKNNILKKTILFAILGLLLAGCGADSSSSENEKNNNGDDNKGIRVDADNPEWTDAQIHLAYADTLAVLTTGLIHLEKEGESMGPDGAEDICGLGCPAPDLSRGALVGKIVAGSKSPGTPFLVGSDFDRLITAPGDLYLIVNDASYNDNHGFFLADAHSSQPGDDDDVSDDDDDSNLPQQCHPGNFIMQVIEVEYGAYAGFGQPFFPDNILGPPSGKGEFASQSSPLELISLGEGGYIVVKMGREIIDGAGVDFIVYENMMYWGGDYYNAYTEAAVVEVSQDGQTWFRFPFDFLIDGAIGSHGLPDTVPENFIGFAGIVPTYANCDPNGDGDFEDMINPLDYQVSGGDPFDLADIGLSRASYIRVIDTGHINRNPGSEMYDNDNDLINDGGNLLAVWEGIQGFDLDAIAVVNIGEELEPDQL